MAIRFRVGFAAYTILDTISSFGKQVFLPSYSGKCHFCHSWAQVHQIVCGFVWEIVRRFVCKIVHVDAFFSYCKEIRTAIRFVANRSGIRTENRIHVDGHPKEWKEIQCHSCIPEIDVSQSTCYYCVQYGIKCEMHFTRIKKSYLLATTAGEKINRKSLHVNVAKEDFC